MNEIKKQMHNKEDRKSSFRMLTMGLIALGLGAVIFLLAPDHVSIILQKLCLVTAGFNVGYWGDRLTFPYSRPGDLKGEDGQWHAEWRRAFIIIGTMVALGLGL